MSVSITKLRTSQNRHIQSLISEERSVVASKGEKLGSISFVAALLTGISSTFVAQLAIPVDGIVKDWLIICYTFFSVLAASLSILALILTSLISIALYNFDTAKAVRQALDQAAASKDSDSSISSPFEEFWVARCEPDFLLAYRFFIAGLINFLIAVVFTTAIQFHIAITTAYVAIASSAIALLWVVFCINPRWGSVITGSRSTDTARTMLTIPKLPPSVAQVMNSQPIVRSFTAPLNRSNLNSIDISISST